MNGKQKQTIKWNVINSLIAGALVVAGSLTDGEITWKGFGAGVIAGIAVAFTKFKSFWDTRGEEVFSFV